MSLVKTPPVVSIPRVSAPMSTTTISSVPSSPERIPELKVFERANAPVRWQKPKEGGYPGWEKVHSSFATSKLLWQWWVRDNRRVCAADWVAPSLVEREAREPLFFFILSWKAALLANALALVIHSWEPARGKRQKTSHSRNVSL